MKETTREREVHAKLVQAWKLHKDRTGASQTKAAQSLGIGQSAFSQYIKGKDRGGIPLNHKFVINFCKYVGTSPEDLGWSESTSTLTEHFIPVRYDTTGKVIKDQKIAIKSSVTTGKNLFAVLLESCENLPLARVGDVFLCTEIEEWKQCEPVFVVSREAGTVESMSGRLVETDTGWAVHTSNGFMTRTQGIPSKAEVYRIQTVYMR